MLPGQASGGWSSGELSPFYFQYHKWYAGLALFSELGTARLEGITP